jgi:nitrogen fixation protein FixH
VEGGFTSNNFGFHMLMMVFFFFTVILMMNVLIGESPFLYSFKD